MAAMQLLLLLITPIVLYLHFVPSGLLFIKNLPLKLSNLEKLILSVITGFAVTAAVLFFGGHLIGTSIYYFSALMVSLGLIEFKNSILLLKSLIFQASRNKYFTIFAIFATLSLYFSIAFSWLPVGGGITVQAGQLHDSIWHIALIKKLTVSIPPEHPSDYSLTVTNYHYFYDLLIASLHSTFKLDIFRLYFQFFPLILTALLAGSLTALGQAFKSKVMGAYLIFFTFFGGSFAYLIPFFIRGNTWGESSFWVSQTFAMMVNPQMIYSLSLVALILILLHKAFGLKNQQKALYVHLLIILILSSSLGFKSYSFVVLGLLYGAYLLAELVLKKNLRVFIYGAVLLLISAPFIWLITGFKTGMLSYKPLWYLDTMIESPDRVNNIRWKFLKDHYRDKGYLGQLLYIRAKELLIFYSGNLGTRAIMFLLPVFLILKRLKFNIVYYFVIIGFIGSSLFPLLFIQKGIPWNTIQFWYYALFFANIFAAAVMTGIHKIFKDKNIWDRTWIILIIGLLLIATLPAYIKTTYEKIDKSEYISANELAMLGIIKPEDKVAICPADNRYFRTSLVVGITGAKVVLANDVQIEILGLDIKDRNRRLEEKIKKLGDARGFRGDKNIDYIICEKELDAPQIKFIERADRINLYRFKE